MRQTTWVPADGNQVGRDPASTVHAPFVDNGQEGDMCERPRTSATCASGPSMARARLFPQTSGYFMSAPPPHRSGSPRSAVASPSRTAPSVASTLTAVPSQLPDVSRRCVGARGRCPTAHMPATIHRTSRSPPRQPTQHLACSTGSRSGPAPVHHRVVSSLGPASGAFLSHDAAAPP